MRLKYTWLLYITTTLFVLSCTCSNNKGIAKKEKEFNKDEIVVDVIRFEKELFACNPNNLKDELEKLNQKHPLFYSIFYNQVLNIPSIGDSKIQLQVMQDFITKKAMRGLYDTVQLQYGDISFLKKELQTCFANYKSYFPEKITPKVYTCISEFSYSVFTATDSILGISLDKYLGEKYIYYPAVFQEYGYMIPTFEKRYMAIDCANVLAANLVPVPNEKSTLLDKMLAEGKILYIVENFLPDKKQLDIIKYNKEKWDFCVNNQTQIWAYFLDKKLLYNTEFEQFKYVQDGPTTYGMPKESPGKVGAWLGWQIIRSYMQQYPNTTLKELIAMQDGQKLLSLSKYKP